MTPDDITCVLKEQFGTALQQESPGVWQIVTDQCRILVLLSEDQSWLRVLAPLTSAETAQPFLEQLLEANFDQTLQTRYALQQGVLWGVFHHSLFSLTAADLIAVLHQLLHLHQRGLSDYFGQLVENRIRQIVQVSKQQGQSLESTLQTLNRFYEEGLMGEIDQGSESRSQTLSAWQRQLERLWSEES